MIRKNIKLVLTGIVICFSLCGCAEVRPDSAESGKYATSNSESSLEYSIYMNKQIQVFINQITTRMGVAKNLSEGYDADNEYKLATESVKTMKETLDETTTVNPSTGADNNRESALTAMQAFELLDVKSGESIFISGGTGSLGAMAIPIAKSLGLKVITSGSARNRDRVVELGVDEFFDYKTQDYSQILSDVDYVLDTLGEKELEKEFKILKNNGSLVSLKGLPNKEFAERMGFSFVKKTLFGFAGMKFDKMAGKKNQNYYFLFVESNGPQLEKVSQIFEQNNIEASVDEVYELSDVNDALRKVDKGGSKGKTLIKI